jgi:hypothetical protein
MQHASLKMILYFKHYAYDETCYEILTYWFKFVPWLRTNIQRTKRFDLELLHGAWK